MDLYHSLSEEGGGDLEDIGDLRRPTPDESGASLVEPTKDEKVGSSHPVKPNYAARSSICALLLNTSYA